MSRVSGLVPSRFLTLLAHLVVVITLFWSRVRTHGCPLASPWSPGVSPSPHPALGLSRWESCHAHSIFTSALLSALLPQDSNVQACLPIRFTREEYEKRDLE